MPVRKQEAHRALELLEDYHEKLLLQEQQQNSGGAVNNNNLIALRHNRMADFEEKMQLRQAIERVIRIFKSRLFQALLDIQEFYEVTLLDESKTLQEKTFETLRIATKWELNNYNNNNLIRGSTSMTSPTSQLPATSSTLEEDILQNNNFLNQFVGLPNVNANTNTVSNKPQHQQQQQRHSRDEGNVIIKSSELSSDSAPMVVEDDEERQKRIMMMSRNANTNAPQAMNMNKKQQEIAGESDGTGVVAEEFMYEEILLERGPSGYGFSIAGGVDNPHNNQTQQFDDTSGGNEEFTDTFIYVTKITPGGASELNGQLRVGDVIVRVNKTSVVEVTHGVAVEALKSSGNIVRLLIRRKKIDPSVAFSSRMSPGISPAVTGGALNLEFEKKTSVHQKTPSPSAAKFKQRDFVDSAGAIEPAPGNISRVGDDKIMIDESSMLFGSSQLQQKRQREKPSIEIELFKDKTCGLGFSIAGGIGNQHIPGDNGIYITRISEGGAAYSDGRLTVGDKLVSVMANNGKMQNLENVTHEDAVGVLKNASVGTTIVLLIIIPSGSSSHLSAAESPLMVNTKSIESSLSPMKHQQPMMGVKSPTSPITPSSSSGAAVAVASSSKQNLRTVVLTRSDGGSLGFNIVGGEEDTEDIGGGIFISYLLPGGPADDSNALQRGDQIISVNGIDLRSASHEDAANALKKSNPLNKGNQVTLVVEFKGEEFNRFEQRVNDLKMNLIQTGTSPGRGIGELTMPRQVGPSSTASMSSSLISEKRTLFVRALFDFDPSRDDSDNIPSRGLTFKFGDVLHVTNACDDEWWQAKCLLSHSGQTGGVEMGLIPSKKRWERKQKSRDRSVKFHGNQQQQNSTSNSVNNSNTNLQMTSSSSFNGSNQMMGSLDRRMSSKSTGGGSNGSEKFSFTRKFPFMKSSRENINVNVNNSSSAINQNNANSQSSDFLWTNERGDGENASSTTPTGGTLSYETVEQINEIAYARPVIILGPLKDRINDDLISEFPSKFGSCVPHTTRQRREYEVDGRDYHFVETRAQMERDIQNHLFIEAGQYNENLYGTSLAAVREVCENARKHCILDVSGNAIRRLYAASLYPIAIFIRPKSVESMLEMNKRMTEEQGRKVFERAQKTELEFCEFFTAIVEGDTAEEIYEKVKESIELHSNSTCIWIPVKNFTKNKNNP